ncbi:hypothetical protein PSQ19_01525 [Devosia algicola]|uniref:Uncharacterized protein n=1 Tax=Devosia algicola TaxID=3026418 RepID=A0ABY7YNN6_9HYPH|nr:hypothetical protein [Devosia algicola]WDR02933.1 hypothetical protein PSQ19_01525 [Devosia algicola]
MTPRCRVSLKPLRGSRSSLLFKGERLSLIESAMPPQQPLGPKRRVLLLASAAAALFMGLVAVAVPEFLNRRIRRPEDLSNKLQIVPFITVPYIERRSFGPMRLAMLIGIIAISALVLVTETNFAPVNTLMSQTSANFLPSFDTAEDTP